MRPLSSRHPIATSLLGLAIALGLGMGLVPAASAGSYIPAEESKVIELVNATRASKGLSKLAKQDGLVGMARRQADRMAAKGTIFHNTDLGGDINRLGVTWLRVGENVGMGPSITLIYDALLTSPEHYKNIVRSDHNSIGLGVVAEGGLRYLVQVFANITGAPAAPVAAKPAPATPKVAPQMAPPVPKAPSSAAPPTAAPVAMRAPKPVPSVRPNALTGGYVRDLELPLSDQGERTEAASGRSDRGFGHLIDILAFWS